MEDKLLSISSVVDKIDRSRAFIYKEIKKGDFPAPVKIGRASMWIDAEITAWIKSFIKMRDAA